jgi:hypothetical protein
MAMDDQLSDFLPEPTVQVELTESDLDLLLHFAIIGHNMCYVRDGWGDRDVCREADPVILRLSNLLADFGG